MKLILQRIKKDISKMANAKKILTLSKNPEDNIIRYIKI